jgi:transposase
MNKKVSSESAVKDIRCRTRKKYSSEEKIRIVIDGLRGEDSISSLCRREGILTNLYYRWNKDFLEARKKHLVGDTTREASSHEVVYLKKENEHTKQLVAEITLKNRVLKKSLNGTDFEGIAL